MQLTRDVTHVKESAKNAVIALGNFDGLHLGHRAIIAEAKKIARASGKKTALMTFEPHPREVLARNAPPLRIYSLHEKLGIIKTLGINQLFLVRFTPQFSQLSAQEFIQTILHNSLAAHHIVTGENFFFGKGRGGDTSLLATSLPPFSIGYTALPPVTNTAGNIVSSSAIRDALATGNVKKASALLGAPYHISGRVKRGEGRGKTIGVPTANIGLEKLFLPAFGVYAVRVKIAGDETVFNGVANLGIKPTFGVHAPLLEVHLFGTTLDLYGKRLCVELVEFIRPEQKFSGKEALVAQIQNDIETAKRLLA